MLSKRSLVVVMVSVLLLLSGSAAPAAQPSGVLVFAAASTTNALEEAGRAFTRQYQVPVTYSFASASTLARQIALGAPANLFLSANLKWMDYLEQRGVLASGTRVNLLRNRLVLVVPTASRLSAVKIARGMNLLALLGAGGRLAMGDPSHVPAGIYGRQALTSLGLWTQAEPRLAAAASVRAALALVERGEAPLGVVYASDALITKRVKVVGRFPQESHPPIVYPAAMIKEHASGSARLYLRFLQGPQAAAIFKKYGFQPY
ncbi:MAG: molybdate ABC transporter substrate-binding protein [Thermodesulfobacteriota bacterium]